MKVNVGDIAENGDSKTEVSACFGVQICTDLAHKTKYQIFTRQIFPDVFGV